MNIIPISGMQIPQFMNRPDGEIKLGGKAAGAVGGVDLPQDSQPESFANVFADALGTIESLDAVTKQDAYNLALGQVDDIGQVMVNAQKKEVSIQLMIQMRDKFLNAYNEVMRMNM